MEMPKRKTSLKKYFISFWNNCQAIKQIWTDIPPLSLRKPQQISLKSRVNCGMLLENKNSNYYKFPLVRQPENRVSRTGVRLSGNHSYGKIRKGVKTWTQNTKQGLLFGTE